MANSEHIEGLETRGAAARGLKDAAVNAASFIVGWSAVIGSALVMLKLIELAVQWVVR